MEIYYPLSFQQERIWLLNQVHPEGGLLNLLNEVSIQGDVNIECLKLALLQLTQAHSALRTAVRIINDAPHQVIGGSVPIDKVFSFTDLSALEEEIILKEIESLYSRNQAFSFDLSAFGLFRFNLIKTSVKKYYCLLNFHHIIADAASIRLFWKDLGGIYNNVLTKNGQEEGSLKRMQYHHFAQHQISEEQGSENYSKQREYWMQQFITAPPVLNLPQSLPVLSVSKAASALAIVDGNELRQLAFKQRVALPSLLLGVFYIVLHKYCGQNDVVIGTFFQGRQGRKEFEEIIGMFINTVALRINLDPGETIQKILRQVHKLYDDAMMNQDHPYQRLVHDIDPSRKLHNSSLFNVTFNYTRTGALSNFGDLTLQSQPVRNPKIIEHDLTLRVYDMEDTLHIRFDYNASAISQDTIWRIKNNFLNVIQILKDNITGSLSNFNIICKEEMEKIKGFNPPPVTYKIIKPVYKLFEDQVKKRPLATAAVFEGDTISYEQLNNKANCLANKLLLEGIKKGDVVPVLLDHSIHLLIAVMAILKAGAVYVPIDPDLPVRRISDLLEELDCKCMLVSNEGIMTPSRSRQSIGLESFFKDWDNDKIYADLTIDVLPEDPIYAIFTSGTTGKPKAALIQHGGVMNRFFWMNEYFGYEAAATTVQTTRFIYDSAVWQLLWPLTVGGKVIILPTSKTVSVPHLLDTIAEYGITIIDFVPSLFNVFLQTIARDNTGKDKIASLRSIIIGGEKINPKDALQFKKLFPGIKITNLYGPTETTIGCVYHEITGTENEVPIGKPIFNTRIFIVDDLHSLQPIGVAGEILIGGNCTGLGYLNDTERTNKYFILDPDNEKGIVYKTGDFGKWDEDGNIYYLGRKDQQVKIRGNRIEISEIEHAVLSFPEISAAAVAVNESEDGVYLNAYFMSSISLSVNDLKEFLLARLPLYMIPATFTQVVQFPMGSGGKIDYKAFPQPNNQLEKSQNVLPANSIQEKLYAIWSEVLKLSYGNFSVNDNFFEIGGHSLKAFEILIKSGKLFRAELSMVQFFKEPTILGMEKLIANKLGTNISPLRKYDRKEYYPLSAAQRQMYILHEMQLGGILYNMPSLFHVKGYVNREKIQVAFEKLVSRHDILRTSFVIQSNQIVQFATQNIAARVVFFETQPDKLTTYLKGFIQPFNLNEPALIRMAIFTIDKNESILVLDMHHIITDAISVGVLMDELLMLYNNRLIPDQSLQYFDYAAWENSNEYKSMIKHQEPFWLNKFSGNILPIMLSADYPRPDVKRFEGNSIHFVVEETLVSELRNFSKREEVTLFVTFLTGLYLLLYKITGQEDLVVGSPFSGRRYPEIQYMVGIFARTLPLRINLSNDKQITLLLQEVKNSVLEANDHQDYPFNELINRLSYKRMPGRNPLYDVIFAFRHENAIAYTNEDFSISPYRLKQNFLHTAKVDLTFWAVETKKEVSIRVEYDSALFKKKTIHGFIEHYISILKFMVNNRDAFIHDIAFDFKLIN